MATPTIRRAAHAGSWYTNAGDKLSRQLDGWLDKAGRPANACARAIIAPHAGYSYCGATAAYAYSQIDPNTTRRIFILGPAHHVYMKECALPVCTSYQTPLGNLVLDQTVISELRATELFADMSVETDEDEHSIEMQLPYIYKVMEGREFTVVPILVGSLSAMKEKEYGEALSKYLKDRNTVWVVSSDFCHWGQRFSFTYRDSRCTEIHESISKLDRLGMRAIETRDPLMFTAYQAQYHNTICGRHAISVLLNALDALKDELPGELKFLYYSQSSKCYSMADSSVSYAAAAFVPS